VPLLPCSSAVLYYLPVGETTQKILTMIYIIINIALIIFAVIFKAGADIVNFHKGGKFKKWFAKNKWYRRHSLFFDMGKTNQLPGTKYPFNAWHIFNSLSAGCYILIPVIDLLYFFPWYYSAGALVVVTAIYILVFNLFYNKILR
jgi:hypothetical protein